MARACASVHGHDRPARAIVGPFGPRSWSATRGQPIRMAASVEPGARVLAAEAGDAARPAGSSSRASSRASASGPSSGAWRPSSGWPAACATRPVAWRSRRRRKPVRPRRLRPPAALRRPAPGASRRASARRRWSRAPRAGSRAHSRSTRACAATAIERLFPPDIATCDDCLREVFDPADRRYRYPFTNCTNCGPRATIIDELPYDRARTTMRAFPLCAACAAEYARPRQSPLPRRAGRVPGVRAAPRLPADGRGGPLGRGRGRPGGGRRGPACRAGSSPIKGLGGYHLACDATDEAAVSRLRDRKRRWAKPFAVMVADLAAAERLARVGADRAPAPRSARSDRSSCWSRGGGASRDWRASVAAGNHRLGVFLPYTPLHHLLLAADRPADRADVGQPLRRAAGDRRRRRGRRAVRPRRRVPGPRPGDPGPL